MVIQQQVEDEWCWAAVAASVDHYFNTASNVTQCSVASTVLAANCCANPDACDCPEELQVALQAINRLQPNGILAFPPQLSIGEIQSQVDASLPVCVRIAWSGGGAHFVAIDGYGKSPSGQYVVRVEDPFYGESVWDLTAFLNSYQGSGFWTATFLVES